LFKIKTKALLKKIKTKVDFYYQANICLLAV